MTMQVKFDSDIKKATRFLDNISKKQIPFATSLALNQTANDVKDKEQQTMQRDLDRPTPNVIKSIKVNRSSKLKLVATIFIIPAVSEFLRYQISGGIRPPRGKTEAVPVGIKLNVYGNIPGRRQGKLSKLLIRPDTFSGTRKGINGIWQRTRDGRAKLLVAYEPTTKYKPRWRFYAIAAKHSVKVWPANFNKALNIALASA